MLNIVHKGRSKKNLIIFIHGLTGDNETWFNSINKSFPGLLYENSLIKKNYDIGFFNYHTKLFDVPLVLKDKWQDIKSFLGLRRRKVKRNINVNDVSDLLYTYLNSRASTYQRIVLVCHSMGGLIAKTLITNYRDTHIVKKIDTFISLAVPHNGAALADIGRVLLPNVQIQNLKPLDKHINDINQGWIDNKDTNPKTYYFQGKYDTIVSETSSVGYDANTKEIMYCDDTHTSISKPESKDSLVYELVYKILTNKVEEENLNKKLIAKNNADLTELEREDFVIKLIIADVQDSIINNAKKRFFEAEVARKIFVQLGFKDDLTKLYTSIEQIYHNAFALMLTGRISDGDELVYYVHERISVEDRKLLKSIAKITFTHKIGMMHQLANLDEEIWWAKNHSITTLEEYKEAKKNKEL